MAIYDYLFNILFVLIGCLFALSGIDELIMIFSFIALKFYELFVFNKKHKILTVDSLSKEKQKPIAVMIACWQEENVIYEMLTQAVSTIQYSNYHLFVGTYPNDPLTQKKVDQACKKHANIHKVVLDHDGPTTKSDNINAIWNNIKKFEQESAIQFEVFVIDDAEDHLPGYGLHIFNHLIPRKDVVQLPVLPLKAPWYRFTAATYMDEFAQLHLMGMRTREWISGSIPTAGVGCGFSRQFLEFATKHNHGIGPLGMNTLTEDYELPLINRTKEDNEIFYDSIVVENQTSKRRVNYVPAVRSHFPNQFRKAVIQKSRWILGIALQGASHLGWRGDFSFKYMLFRDRKPIVTNLLTFIGLIFLILFTIDYFVKGTVIFHNIFTDNTLYAWIIKLNVLVMIVLIVVRMLCTSIVYGPLHGLLSLPRIFLGNFINGIATIRAIRLYVKSKKDKSLPKWDKTRHEI